METNEILNKLKLLTRTREEVRFVDDSKGVPMEFNANVSSVCGNAAIFDVFNYQLASLAFGKQTFIQSDVFPETIQSNIKEIDIVKGTATLTDFRYATVPIVKRKTMRAQPEDAIMDVAFKYKDVGILAELVDLSECGIGIYAKTPLRVPVPVNAFIHIQLLDPEVSTCLELELSCDVKNTNREEDLYGSVRYRTGMQIFPDEGAKQKITEYVFQRQVKQTYELKKYYYVHSLQ